MKSVSICVAGLVLTAVLYGCAATWQGTQGIVASQADMYREQARNFEDQGELQLALFTWHIVAKLEKDNTVAIESIQRIKQTAAKAANDHFQRGSKFYQAGDYKKALREFLIALRTKPDHRQARHYLKTRLQNPQHTTYQVQPGDSFTRIAAKIFKDPGKAYIIAYFNGLDPKKPLLIGQTLWLPAIDPNYLKPRSNVSILLEKAQSAYAEKRYDETVSLTRKIHDEVPDHPKARLLADAAHFDMGMDMLKQKAYMAAVEQFKQVSPNFKGRNQAIAKARNHIKQLVTEKKLSQAQLHLRNNDWQRVINVAEEILEHDPNNAQAKMLFSNASYNLGKFMLDRGDVSQAVKLLDRIDPSYEDTGQMLSLARARMKSQAETHYRNGVKHFINEDLELAIKDWKRALELNPEHPKARQDIENAEHLLDKLEAFE